VSIVKRFVDLGFLFTVVAVLEFSYFGAAMMPPGMIRPATGWVLGPDGHWITKLMGVALLTQAYIAWIFRKSPHLGVAKGLAFYQMASATTDWVMWLFMMDAGIFSNALAKATVVAAIVSHYLLGFLLVVAIARLTREASS
jgi:hypothetical protein